MANGLNKVMLIGNVGADPDYRMTGSGAAVLKIRLATSETYLDRDRQKQERTEWHSVILWGKRAEALSNIITKGSRLYIEGGLRTTSWEDKESGQKRYKTEINADNIILLGSSGERGQSKRDALSDGGAPPADDYDDGDIPF